MIKFPTLEVTTLRLEVHTFKSANPDGKIYDQIFPRTQSTGLFMYIQVTYSLRRA